MTTRVIEYQKRIETKIDWIFSTTRSFYAEKGRGVAWVTVTKRETLLRYETLSEWQEFMTTRWPVGIVGITEDYMQMYKQFVGELERYDAENEVIVCLERYKTLYVYKLRQAGNKINCTFVDLDEIEPSPRKAKVEQKSFTKCDICGVRVREDRLTKHISKAHSTPSNTPDLDYGPTEEQSWFLEN